MALSQRHRASLFTTLTPLVGEEEAEALLAEFPSHDLDVPATKDFVRAEIGELRAEFGEVRSDQRSLRAEFGDLRTEFAGLRSEFGDLRTEFAGLRSEFGDLRAEFGDLRVELTAMELRISEKLRLQMVWLTGLLIAAIGLVAALT